MALAVYGKHPAKGDFLEYGVPAALKPALEGWLDTVLAEAKAALAGDWQTVWPAAPMLRFWLGEGIWGAPLAGVMASAQDRVGRRFPLVLLALGEAGITLPPPVIDTDQSWYDAACAHLGVQLLRDDLPGPAALIQDAPQPVARDTSPGPRDFWAVRPGADVTGLLADIALTDHRRANEGRSYWWVAGMADAVAPGRVDDPLPVALGAAGDDGDTLGAVEPVAPEVAGPDLPPQDDDAAQDAANGWTVPDAVETDASPFASPFASDANGISLFAAPETGPDTGGEIADDTPSLMIPATPAAPRQLWSQVWAGPGLPSGAVLAWFFRGHAGND